ncbi:uncharacterized protein LOC135692427 [Rhopilema esculentum]|uniref:uncharacterized protein LOC135692427 n=1 Tax=Rhopilema esculentum TaxID=499914 RepID=UPI0031E2FCA9
MIAIFSLGPSTFQPASEPINTVPFWIVSDRNDVLFLHFLTTTLFTDLQPQCLFANFRRISKLFSSFWWSCYLQSLNLFREGALDKTTARKKGLLLAVIRLLQGKRIMQNHFYGEGISEVEFTNISWQTGLEIITGHTVKVKKLTESNQYLKEKKVRFQKFDENPPILFTG